MYKKVSLGLLTLLMFGCSDYITHNIPKNGIVKYEDVKWPKMDSSWIKEGTYPNIDNLKKIRKNMTKDQIYSLISHPHYAEGIFSPIEWDYLFNFISKDNKVYKCQYKIIFDKDRKAQSFFFKPKNCLDILDDSKEAKVKELVLLFDFDKYDVKDEELRRLKEFMKEINKNSIINIRAYADYLGTDYYNLKLADNRAKSVEKELNALGFSEVNIIIFGEREQIKVCDEKKTKDNIMCLKPNRRVIIEIQEKVKN